MCQYLFAAFSLKQREDEGLTADRARRRRPLAEEHLARGDRGDAAPGAGAQPAVGDRRRAALGRPNLPAPAQPLSGRGEADARSRSASRRCSISSSWSGRRGWSRGRRRPRPAGAEAVPLMSERDIVPQPQDFATVGHLYRSIEEGFGTSPRRRARRTCSSGRRGPRRSRSIFGWPELVAVTDLASAQRRSTDPRAGRGRSRSLGARAFRPVRPNPGRVPAVVAANPEFDPVRPVMVATVRRRERDGDGAADQRALTSRCADLFNVSYEILLQIFERYFAHTEESDEQLGTLADATVAIMLRVLRPLGNLITTLPVGPDHPGDDRGTELRAVLRERLPDAAPRGRLGAARGAAARDRELLRAGAGDRLRRASRRNSLRSRPR